MARLALYDPDEDDEPPAAGAAASTDPVAIVHAEQTSTSSQRPRRRDRNQPRHFWYQRQIWCKRQTTFLWGTRRLLTLLNQEEEVQPEEREQSGQGAAEGAPGEVIGTLILGEEADQPSSPEEELIDNHPLLEPEPDWEQGSTEAVAQNAEEDAVQTSPPERSRSRDSGRSRSSERVATATPIPACRPVLCLNLCPIGLFVRGTKYENRLARTWEICSWHKRILYLGGWQIVLGSKRCGFCSVAMDS